MICRQHLDGINRSRLGRREGIGAATVERYFQHGLERQFAEWNSRPCPRILGIDEHFFTRKKGFATTLCDLGNHKIYDVVLGRSELSLEAYFHRLEGKAAPQLEATSTVCRQPAKWRALSFENRQSYFFTKAATAAYTVVASNNTITPTIIICLDSPRSF
jgi:hypothetical protein